MPDVINFSGNAGSPVSKLIVVLAAGAAACSRMSTSKPLLPKPLGCVTSTSSAPTPLPLRSERKGTEASAFWMSLSLGLLMLPKPDNAFLKSVLKRVTICDAFPSKCPTSGRLESDPDR